MKHFLLITFLLAAMASTMQAQWTQLTGSDLELSSADAVIKHGDDWYIGTAGGVFKSTDNGQNWALSNNNLFTALGRLRVEGFVSSGANLVAMNRWSGIVTTTDGSTWAAFNSTNLPTNYFISETMVVVGSRVIIVVKDNDTDTYYLYYSTDNGVNWTQGAELTGAGTEVFIASTGDKAYIVHENAGNDEFLGETTDGETLNPPSFDQTYTDTEIENVNKSGNFLVVNSETEVYRYDLINGGNWLRLTVVWTNNGLNIISIAGNGNDRIYASAFEGNGEVGLHTSTDGALNWTQLLPPLTTGQPFAMGFYATGNEFMAAFIDEGIHYSSNSGTNIARRNNGLLGSDFEELFVSGNNLLTALFISGVYGSADNGNTWAKRNTGLPTDPIQSVSDFTTDGTSIFVNYYEEPEENPIPNQVFKSTDNGQNWTEVAPPATFTNLKLLGANGSTLFAYSDAPNTAYFTTSDGGTNWTNITANIPANFTPHKVTGDGTTAFLAGYDTSSPGENYLNIYTSTDNGATGWTLTMAGIDTPSLQNMDGDDDIMLLTPAPGIAFLVVTYQNYNHLLYRWNVTQWESVAASGVSNVDFESMAYHNSELYVSVWNEGVLKSSNNGDSFTEIGNLEDGISANAIAFIGDVIYISSNRGLWTYDLTTAIENEMGNPHPFSQTNPTNGLVYMNQNASNVEIYSLEGSLIKEITPHQKSFDVSDLPNGMYIVIITTDAKKVTRKLVKQ